MYIFSCSYLLLFRFAFYVFYVYQTTNTIKEIHFIVSYMSDGSMLSFNVEELEVKNFKSRDLSAPGVCPYGAEGGTEWHRCRRCCVVGASWCAWQYSTGGCLVNTRFIFLLSGHFVFIASVHLLYSDLTLCLLISSRCVEDFLMQPKWSYCWVELAVNNIQIVPVDDSDTHARCIWGLKRKLYLYRPSGV